MGRTSAPGRRENCSVYAAAWPVPRRVPDSALGGLEGLLAVSTPQPQAAPGTLQEGFFSLKRELLEGVSLCPGPCGFRKARLCQGLQEVAVGSKGGPAPWGLACLTGQPPEADFLKSPGRPGRRSGHRGAGCPGLLSPLLQAHPWLVMSALHPPPWHPSDPKEAPTLHQWPATPLAS